MKFFWLILAAFAYVFLAFGMLFKNCGSLVYNLSHERKKRIYWHPLDHVGEFEDSYHD